MPNSLAFAFIISINFVESFVIAFANISVAAFEEGTSVILINSSIGYSTPSTILLLLIA